MKQRYKLYNELDMYLGEITKHQVIKGLEWNLIEPIELGDSYRCYGFYALEFFNKDFNRLKKEEKQQKVNCWKCGKEVKTKEKYKRVYCDECSKEKAEQERIDLLNYTILRKKMMLERAIKILENQEKKINFMNYKDAIEAVEEYIKEYPNKFDSAHEIAVAIELVRKQVKIKVQPTIEDMKFDFMIPNDKVILEIDGYLHKYRVERDSIRDLRAREILGEEWEVIRIPTEYIEKNIYMLYQAIKQIYEYKKELRSKYNGVLPEYYSDREKAIWEL